jgi:hypothetical protein
MVEERTRIEERPPEFSEIEPAPRRGARGVTGAVLLIGLGTALLLSNLGIITLNWLTLVQFWPVVLILIGLDIAFGGRSAAGSVVVALVALAVVFGVIFWSGFLGNTVGGSGDIIEGEFSQEIGEATALHTVLDLGVANTEVGSMESDTEAVSGTFSTDDRFQIESSYQVEDGKGILRVEQRGDGSFGSFIGATASEVNLDLNNALPLELEVNAGVGELTLDLSDVLLVNLSIDAGVGNVTVTLPGGESYHVDVDAGVGNVTIELPEDDEIRIVHDGGLGNLDLDEERFTEVSEDVWETEDYNDGTGIEINVDAGVGNVEFD